MLEAVVDTVSMLEFRQNAEQIIQRVRRGVRLVLTYRGKPVMRLEPVREDFVREDDPIYGLAGHAARGGKPLTNAQMDAIVYEDE